LPRPFNFSAVLPVVTAALPPRPANVPPLRLRPPRVNRSKAMGHRRATTFLFNFTHQVTRINFYGKDRSHSHS
jgi:hypothetical protein